MMQRRQPGNDNRGVTGPLRVTACHVSRGAATRANRGDRGCKPEPAKPCISLPAPRTSVAGDAPRRGCQRGQRHQGTATGRGARGHPLLAGQGVAVPSERLRGPRKSHAEHTSSPQQQQPAAAPRYGCCFCQLGWVQLPEDLSVRCASCALLCARRPALPRTPHPALDLTAAPRTIEAKRLSWGRRAPQGGARGA